MGGDAFEDSCAGDLGSPVPGAMGEVGVEDQPSDVHGAVGAVADGVRAARKAVVAPSGEFGEGEAVEQSAADVAEAGLGRRAGASLHLLDEKAGEVLRVKGVSDLQAVTAEAEVAQGAFFTPGVDPVGDDALIRAAELAGAGEDAATVDPDREPESGVVFEGQLLRAELAGAIQRERCLGGKGFGEAHVGNARVIGGPIHPEALTIRDEGDVPEGLDAVNARGAEHEEAGVSRSAEFKHVEGANEVVFEQLPAAGATVESGEDAGVGSGVDEPVHVRQALEVAGLADIPVEQADAEALQGQSVDLGPRAAEVIHPQNGPSGLDQVADDLAADEAAGSGDEDALGGGRTHA